MGCKNLKVQILFFYFLKENFKNPDFRLTVTAEIVAFQSNALI